MAETRIDAPIPLVWMGTSADIEQLDEWRPGFAFTVQPGGYAAPRDLLRPGLTRDPIVVMCPAFRNDAGVLHATPFCIDTRATASSSGYWETTGDESSLVVGSRPRITISPSIHLVGIWHGWLRDGELIQA